MAIMYEYDPNRTEDNHHPVDELEPIPEPDDRYRDVLRELMNMAVMDPENFFLVALRMADPTRSLEDLIGLKVNAGEKILYDLTHDEQGRVIKACDKISKPALHQRFMLISEKWPAFKPFLCADAMNDVEFTRITEQGDLFDVETKEEEL